jgi:hypothetical protein
MPTPTYTPLATVTLGSSASSVTFSSIPATYRDLILIFEGTLSASADLTFTLNGDTSNRAGVVMFGTGSSTGSGTRTAGEIGFIGSGRSNMIIQVMDYSATDKHKTLVSRSNAPAEAVAAYASRWGSTAAVTSFAVVATSGRTILSGSTFSLYGVIA